ncbi:unnamed protein product [Miscanthus lutarioriparius]|uniref:Pentatricopeptide repeat-containing protein n=1 Tax=Miscanthus lutarioriparius TaxID=422564 RepID=A0A811P5T1_9POAL|nr:unnamed protein product [Miscanthus lutarioriparius]
MILWRWPKCTAEWFRHRKLLPWEVPSCPYSTIAAPVQCDDSSGDEKLNFAPDNEPIQKLHRSLSSDSVVQTLRCLRRKPAVAFAYFKDTHSLGFHHDFSTYSEIIQILSHSFQGKMLVSLFGEILSGTGSGGPEILALIDHLRETCATSHVLSYAVNCLIKAYTTCHNAQETVEMFCHLCRLGFVPTLWACNFLLKFVSQSNDSHMVVAAYDQMKCFQLTLDAQSLNIVTRSLFQANKADEAFQVWVGMIEMGVKLDVHVYSSFIIGLCDCRKYDLAYNMVRRYAVLQEISQERVPIEAMAYNMVIDGLCKEMKLEEAEKVLEIKTRHGSTPDLYGYSYLIHSHCKMGNLETAWYHIEDMCLRKLGMISEVIVHFQKFRDLGLHLDGVLYNIAMDAYCKLGNMNEAVKLLNEMMAEGWTDHAYTLFLRVAKQGNMVDHLSCSKLINGLCRDEKVEEASTVCSMMLEKNVVPDVISYSKLISAYCQSRDMHNAHLWFHDMVERGLSDVIVYTVLMNGYCKVGRLQEACELFVQMINLGIKPDVVAYTVLLDGHLKETLQQGWQGIAKERRTFFLRTKHKALLSSMKDMEIEPDVTCYTVLIDGQCKAEYLEEARGLFDEMLAKGLSPDVYTYTALINGYCSQGEIAKAEDLFQEMIDEGMKPDVLSFSVLHQRTLRHRKAH